MKNKILSVIALMLGLGAGLVYAGITGAPADIVGSKADLMYIYDSTGNTQSAINWESMTRSMIGTVNWVSIVPSTGSVNWAQIILPSAP